MPETESKPLLEIGGRKWRGLSLRSLTIGRKVEIRRQLMAAHLLDDLGAKPAAAGKPAEDGEAWARRVLRRLEESGHLFLLLGHLLTPAELPDQDWTPATAEETARHFARLVNPVDEQKLYVAIVDMLVFFWLLAGNSASSTPTASNPAEAARAGAPPPNCAAGGASVT